MNISPDHIDDLIARYLAGEASPAQIAFVEEWTAKSETNRRYFHHMSLIFEKAATGSVAEQFDTDKAWARVRAKLSAKGKAVSLPRDGSSRYYFLRIAAGVIILITAGIFSYQYFDNRLFLREVSADKETAADTLPDGSSVFLNRQTTVEYSFDKKTNVHTARLTGEAYFTIRHSDEKIFIVGAEGTFIKDIGTSFNVKAYPESRTIEVVVEEGEVLFYTEKDPGIHLKANDKGTYDKDTGKFTVGAPGPNVTAYKTKFFSFSNHSLEQVVETLNGVYPKQIHIGEHLKHCRLTVSFNDERIEEIAQVIAETLGLTVSEEHSAIRLMGSGCGEAQPQ